MNLWMGYASHSMFINFVQYCLYFSPINTENLCHIYSCEEVLLGKAKTWARLIGQPAKRLNYYLEDKRRNNRNNNFDIFPIVHWGYCYLSSPPWGNWIAAKTKRLQLAVSCYAYFWPNYWPNHKYISQIGYRPEAHAAAY